MADHVSPAEMLFIIRRAKLWDNPDAMKIFHADIATNNQFVETQTSDDGK
jgi:hypothetical protein